MASGTVIVTGANGGLGSAFVQNLLPTSYHGIFTVRGLTAQSSGTLKEILASTSMSHAIIPLDLGSLAAIRAFAEDINSQVSSGKIPKIRALVLNAGIQTFHGVKYSGDGIETTFAVNYLANFLLVLLLLKSMDPEKGRVIAVSSWCHDTSFYMNNFVTDKIVFRDPEVMAHPDYEDKEGDYWPAGMRRYGLSKLCMLMFGFELQQRLNNDPKLSNISVLSMDPGGMPTSDIARDSPLATRVVISILTFLLPFLNFCFPSLPFRTTQKSADDLYFASFDEKELGIHPKAVTLDGSKRLVTSEESRDEEKWERLWEGSVKLVGLKEGDTVLAKWR